MTCTIYSFHLYTYPNFSENIIIWIERLFYFSAAVHDQEELYLKLLNFSCLGNDQLLMSKI